VDTARIAPIAFAISGGSGSAATVGGPIPGTFEGVSCTAAADCTAVGAANPNAAQSSGFLAEHWNGSEWTVQSSPPPSGKTGTHWYGAACVGPGSCLAVGNGADDQPVFGT